MDIYRIKKREPHFPKRLKTIPDAPDELFYAGELPDESKKSAAIIGARECSQYGRIMAEHLAGGLAKEGVQIISGMALGIDGISQMAALKAGGKSFAVLGSGVDVCYPKSNRKLYDNLLKSGGIISEYDNGTGPASYNFPRRNRLISGLCDVLIVIEARLRSGTFITVDFALEQGREIMALPGRVTAPLSIGCNALISQGAHPVQCVKDVMDVLDAVPLKSSREDEIAPCSPRRGASCAAGNIPYTPRVHNLRGLTAPEKSEKIVSLDGDEASVYGCLDLYPLSTEELAETAGLPLYALSETLVSLELKGLIKEISKGNYIRLT